MWSGLTLTENGKQALISAQLSNVLNIKSIVIGDGDAPADYHKCNELVHQLYELTDLKVDTVTEGCQITVDFPNVDYDYYFREIGVIVTTDSGDVLYVYDNAGDDAQCIHAENTAGKIQKRLRLVLAISDVKNITISKTSPLYVDYDEFTKHTSDAEHHTTVQEKAKWNNMLSEAKEYSDATYQQAAGYTDKKIADLIGGAPETLDTLEEVATAIKENEDVVKALDAAIGKKANQSELDTHTGNDTIHITSAERKQWNGYKEQIAGLNSNLGKVKSVIGANWLKKATVSTTTSSGAHALLTVSGNIYYIYSSGNNLSVVNMHNDSRPDISLTANKLTISITSTASANMLVGIIPFNGVFTLT